MEALKKARIDLEKALSERSMTQKNEKLLMEEIHMKTVRMD